MKVRADLEKNGLIQFCGLVSSERANSRMNCMTIVWWATCDIKSCFCKHKIAYITTSYNQHAMQHQLIFVTCKTLQVSEPSFFSQNCEAPFSVEIHIVDVKPICRCALNVISMLGNSSCGGVITEVNQKHKTIFFK